MKGINSYVMFDTETGGLDCRKNPVTQIALVAIKGDTLEKIDVVSTHIKQYMDDSAYEKAAMDYTGITFDELENGVSLKDAVDQIIELLTKADLTPRNKGSKPIFCAYNSAFDKGFLLQMFTRCNKMKELERLTYGHTDFFGNYQPEFLDIIHLTKMAYGADEGMPNFKLGTCVSKAGIDLSDAHSAFQDTIGMKDMTIKIINTMRSTNTNNEETVSAGRYRNHFQF